MRNHPLATAAIAITASGALLAAAFAGSTGLVMVLVVALVVPVSAIVAGRFLLGAGAARPQRASPGGAADTTDPTPTRPDDPTASIATMLGGFVAAVMIVAAGGIVGLVAHGSLDHPSMMVGGSSDHMAFMLDSVGGDVAAHYAFAKEHRELFSTIPCYCGCEATLDHRHLYDCFVRPDGAWESHASGCAVCIDESKMARRLLGTGAQPEQVRDAIVARYEALVPR
jgi:hypothetical protein